MKKVLVIAVMTACMFSFVSAQDKQENFKPKAGDFSLEVGFAPFAQDGIINEGALAGFIHFTDKVALRIGLSLGTVSETWDNGKTGSELKKTKESALGLTLSPGIVYSFKGTPRLTPYIGGGINFGILSTREKVEYGNDETITKHPSGFDSWSVGLGVGTGFNYYFAKKLYVGAEVNLGFDYVTFLDETIKGDPKPTNKHHGAEFGINAYPLLRLGWTF